MSNSRRPKKGPISKKEDLAHIENIPAELRKEVSTTIDLPIWLKEKFKQLPGAMKYHIHDAMVEYLDRKTSVEVISDFIEFDLKDQISVFFDNLEPSKKLDELLKLYEQTIDFIKMESLGIAQAQELQFEKKKLDIIQIIHHDYPLESTPIAKIALESLIEEGRVLRTEDGGLEIAKPRVF